MTVVTGRNHGTWATIAVALFALSAITGLFRITPTYAQSRASGEIRGTVLDSSGAVIPGVAITIKNEDTGVITNLKSDSTGVYDAASVDPGTYTVSFEKEGFKKFTTSNSHFVPVIFPAYINLPIAIADIMSLGYTRTIHTGHYII